jgi:adenylate cyclase
LKPNDILQARKFFKRAIELDPAFAMPHTELADLIVFEVIYFASRPLSDLQLAAEEAQIAIELDPRDATAHTILARSLGNAGAFSLAFDHVDRALTISPDSVDALR